MSGLGWWFIGFECGYLLAVLVVGLLERRR
jgi:hypothetical protein